MMYPESGLAVMRARAAEIRKRLNEVDQILAVIDDGARLDWRELTDVATASFEIHRDADDLNRYAATLAAAAMLGDLEPLTSGRIR